MPKFPKGQLKKEYDAMLDKILTPTPAIKQTTLLGSLKDKAKKVRGK